MHRTQTGAHLPRDFGPGSPLGAQFGHSDDVYRMARPPDLLALRTCQCQPRAHPLADQLAFEFSDAREDSEDQASVRR